jgi:formylmethanofuran dehydrogenase subunit B
MSMNAEPNPSEKIIEDATCTFCGCLCDDIALSLAGSRITSARNACALGQSWFVNRPPDDRPACTIEGEPSTVDQGVERAAQLLLAARYPLVFGLSATTTAAQRRAVVIADRIRGCVGSTSDSDGSIATIAFQEVGQVACTLGEIKNRSDLIIFWGSDPTVTHPRHFERYSVSAEGEFVGAGRAARYCVVVDSSKTATADLADQFILIKPGKDFEAFWTLRALIKGIELDAEEIEAQTGVSLADWRALLSRITQAKYGALLYGAGSWRAGADHLSSHAMLALVRDLNDLTRFVCMPMIAGGNLVGAENVLTWQTGYPSPVSLTLGYPRYGPGEYNAAIMLGRAEPDAVLVVGGDPARSLSTAAREHLSRLPAVVLVPDGMPAHEGATVVFHTATYGINTSGTVYRMDGVPIPLRPAVTSTLPSDEEVLSAIENSIARSRSSW